MPQPVHVLATVAGPANRLLQGERPALNLLAHLSAIATRARAVVRVAADCGFAGRIAGTRKTTPGLRLFEKYALMLAGCDPHRSTLSSPAPLMLKDNHIDAAGSIEAALRAAHRLAGLAGTVEVECRSLQDALLAASLGAHVVMLDNFAPADARLAAARVKSAHPRVVVEVSGGISTENVTDYFAPSIDVISMGSLTRGCPPIDLSLKVCKEGSEDFSGPRKVNSK